MADISLSIENTVQPDSAILEPRLNRGEFKNLCNSTGAVYSGGRREKIPQFVIEYNPLAFVDGDL